MTETSVAIRQLRCDLDNALETGDICTEVNTAALQIALDELDAAQSSGDQAATREIDLRQRVAELETENQRLIGKLNLAVAQMGVLARGD